MAMERTRQVERISAISLVDQVADRLVHGIASGRIQRGERLIEQDLAEDLGISRIPLREAMSMLETQGILVAEPRRGRRVAEYGIAQIRHVCESRLALERFAVQQAAITCRREPTRLQLIDAVLRDMKRDLAAGADPLRVNQNDVNFHTEIYAATDNSYLQMLWEALARHVVIVFALETFRRYEPEKNFQQHQHLRELLVSGAPEALDAEIAAHIMSYGGALPASS